VKKCRILVVEDEAIVADDIQRTLVRLGYDVLPTAASGREAIEFARNLHPQLVLMDIRLQGPMDGIEAATVIRSECEIPIVCLTSHSDDATLARAMETAPSGYLLKPFGDRELRTAIEVGLRKHQLEARLAERERWLSTILQSIGDAVIVTDLDEVVTVMNAVAETLTGYNDGRAIGRPLHEVFRLIDSSGNPVRSPVAKALQTRDGSLKPAPGLADGLGLADYIRLVRGDGTELPVAETCAPIWNTHGGVTGAVLVFRDTTNQRVQQQRLEALALLDPLTGIANRRALELRLSHELTRSKRYNRPLSCLMADIDGFKAINDKYGHPLGDEVLAAFAQLLATETRARIDLVARYGGEEFVFILPETPLAGAIAMAERVRARVASVEISSRKLRVTASIGVATDATEDILLRADRAMYQAKQTGRNRVAVWADATREASPIERH
jgi:diguanylate cyclase (GGDEF)-like protein